MHLSLLLTTPSLCAYYDDAADILFLEFQEHLTLAKAQVAEAEVLRLALHRSYARVIISTYHLSGLEQDACSWLRQALAPGLQLLGVQKLAWVCRPQPGCLALAHAVLADLPVLATLFNDLEHAASWLPCGPHTLAAPAPRALEARRTRHLARALRRRILTSGRPLPCYLTISLLRKNRLLMQALPGVGLLQPRAFGWAEAAPRQVLHMGVCLAS